MEFLLQPLTLLTFFPILGVLVLLFVKAEQKNAIRWVALGTSLITLVRASIFVSPVVVPARRAMSCGSLQPFMRANRLAIPIM